MRAIVTEEAESSGGRPHKAEPEVYEEVVEDKGVCSTADVHEEVQNRANTTFDISTARRRLNDLADEGKIVRRGTGGGHTWMSYNAFDAVVKDDEFIGAIRSLGGLETTDDIVEKTGFDKHAVLKRLQKLENEGAVKSRNAGGDGATLWAVRN